MHLVSIDIGSYSIKFLHSYVEKKKITHQSWRENVTNNYETGIVVSDERKLQIVKEFLDTMPQDARIIFQCPNKLLTTRFLTLPVKQRKKAELMVPFQLEEDIPFPLSETHYSFKVQTLKNNSKSLVSICKKDEFAEYFEHIKKFDLMPQALTSEVSLVENFFSNPSIDLATTFCLLDIGHDLTKAYFFVNREVVSTHTCYVAGKKVDEQISAAYHISLDEAAIYKHQNSFFLTTNQHQTANDDQKLFADMMEKLFNTFLNDFRRWELGFRVSHGYKVGKIYLTGGSSNIKNFENFLTEKTGIVTEKLDTFLYTNSEKIDKDIKLHAKFNLSNMMAFGFQKKSKLINFLTGQYSLSGKNDIPVHSISFIATRIAMVTAVLLVSLLIERVFVNKDIKKINSKLTNIVKNPTLKINGSERRMVTKRPSRVLMSMKRKKRAITQEIKTIQSSIKINAFLPLKKISEKLVGLNVEIIQFDAESSGDFTVMFKAEHDKDLKKLEDVLNMSNFRNTSIRRNKKTKTLTLSAMDRL